MTPLPKHLRVLRDGDPEHDELKRNIKYLNTLIFEVANGELPMSDAKEFELFKTKAGKIILKNIGLFCEKTGGKMSGFGNPLKEIPVAIFQSLKRKITRRGSCAFCGNKKWLSELEKDYLGRYVCKGSKSDNDCKSKDVKP